MPHSEWLTLNGNRRYPFVTAAEFDVDTGQDFPDNAAFLDAGFTLGINSNFEPGRDKVYLEEWRVTPTHVYFSFKVEYGATSDYNPFLCYRWVFGFDRSAAVGATTYSVPERDTGNIGDTSEQNPALGLAFLTVGSIEQITSALSETIGFFVYVPQVEPSLLQTQHSMFVNAINVANEPRACPPECPCDESSSSSLSSSSPAPVFAGIIKTVGSGGDYATWELALNALQAESPLANNYWLQQISDITENGMTAASIDLNSYTVILDNTQPHLGDPTQGYTTTLSTVVINRQMINIAPDGPGILEIKNLNMRIDSGNNILNTLLRTESDGGVDTRIHDCIAGGAAVAASTAFEIGQQVGPSNDNEFHCWNLIVSNVNRAIDIDWKGITPVGDKLFENITFFDTVWTGFELDAFDLTLNNVIGFNGVDVIYGSPNAATANGCASDDASVNNFGGGAGNFPNITPGDEIVSTNITSSDYGRVKAGGVAAAGGVTPQIAENTLGIRGNPRPHSPDVSIGADELVSVPSSSSSSSSSLPGACVDPLPPEPTAATVPLATALPSGTFIGDVKLKEGYNCLINVTGNIMQVTAGLEQGEGMQCEDLRMASDGSLLPNSCVVCSGWLYALNSQGYDVEHLQLIGGPGVIIDPDPAQNRVVVRFEEEGICEVDI